MVFACSLTLVTILSPARAEPEHSDASAQLGRKLFFDTSLSADGKVSCASCHQPDRLFTDGRARAVGVGGREGTRNTPSLLDVSRQKSLFWEGRRTSLESQALDPMTNPIEHGLSDERSLLTLLRGNPQYRDGFAAAFGVEPPDISADHVRSALAAYQRTLHSTQAPVDRFLTGSGEALSPRARAGWSIFSGLADCVRCHAVDRPIAGDGPPLFTDHAFHSIGVGQAKIARKLPQLVASVEASRRAGTRIDHLLLTEPDVAELGRFIVTLDVTDLGRFKTPSLRNVALTAPYMHDGSVATLQEAVDREIYYRGHRDGRPLVLTPQEREDLIHFLVEGLTTQVETTDGAQAGQASRIARK